MLQTIKKYWSEILIVIILLLAGFFRLWHLNSTPGWWPDEGVYLNISNNLLHGKAQMFAFTYPFFPHPPLYFLLATVFIKFLGYKILSLRILASILGVILVFISYMMGRATNNKIIGIIAAILIAFMPETVIISKVGLTYNLLAIFYGLFLYFLYCYLKTKETKYFSWIWVVTGLGCLTSISAVPMVITAGLLSTSELINKRLNWNKILLALLLFIVPILLYLGWELITQRGAFIHDLKYLFIRTDITSSKNSFLNFIVSLFGINGYLILGLIGLFFLPKNFRLWTLTFVIIILLTEYQSRKYFAWYGAYYIFIFYFGLANGILKLSKYFIEEFFSDSVKVQILKNYLSFFILFFIIYPNVSYLSNKISTRQFLETNYNRSQEESFSTGNVGYVYLTDAVLYINDRVNENDTVLASPHLSWMINALPTDPLLSYVYQDKASTNFPSDMRTTDRFLYNASISKAKFLLDDKFSRSWFYNQPGLKNDMNIIYDTWPKVFEAGDFHIYQNPIYSSK